MGGASEDNGASFAQLDAGELQERVFADHHFFDGFAFAQTNNLRTVEVRSDLSTQNEGETLKMRTGNGEMENRGWKMVNEQAGEESIEIIKPLHKYLCM